MSKHIAEKRIQAGPGLLLGWILRLKPGYGEARENLRETMAMMGEGEEGP